MRLAFRRLAASTSLKYIALASLWILVSDLVLGAVSGSGDTSVGASIVKGLVFVAVTGAILYGVLRVQLKRWHDEVIQRERAEADKHASEERFRRYVEHAPVGLVVFAPDGTPVEANRAALESLGSSAETLRTLPSDGIVAPESVGRAVGDITRLTPGQSLESQLVFVRPDGDRVWIQQRAVRLEDGHILSFGFDITQAKARERAMERLGLLYRASSRISEAAARATERDALLQDICTIAAEVGFPLATMASRDPGGAVRIVARAGPVAATLGDEPVTDGCVSERCLAEGVAIVVADTSASPTSGARARALGVGPCAAWPIRIGDVTEVAFAVCSGPDAPFSAEDLALLEHIANNVGFALGNLAREAERRATEAALRESEERFRLLTQTIGEVFWMAMPGPDMTLYVSPAFEGIWGLSCEAVRLSPRLWIESVLPADRGRVEAGLGRLARGGSYDLEYRITRTDGAIRWINDRGYARLDDLGRVVLTSGVATDITAKKVADEQLRKLSRAVEQSASAILITRIDGAIEYVNSRFTEVMGFTLDEVVGQNPRILQSGQTPRDEYERLWEQLRAGQQWRGELVNRAKDGRIMTVLATISPIIDDDGKTTHYLAVQEDVTERRKAEQAAKESDARFKALVESVPAGIFVAANGRFEYVNRMATEVFGAPGPEALIGTEVLDRFLAESRAQVAERMSALGSSRDAQPWPLMEARCVTLDGNTFEAELSAAALGAPDANAPKAIVFLRDIGDRRRLEAQLRQAQKMEAVGTLAGGVAHDFNNLLTVIQSGASMLQAGDVAPAEAMEIAQEIRDASERAATLTRQLLLFSRMERMVPQDVDLNGVVTNFARMLRRIVGEQITLSTSHAPDLPLVHGDVGMIEQVLMNLVVNARDAMPTGGRLDIRTASGIAGNGNMPADARPGPFAALIVSDSGVGMSPEVLAHVFEPFFTTKEVGRGTGLGLATVYGIVKQHQGWIEIDSTPGVGTTIEVRFPAAAARRGTRVKAATVQHAKDGGHETILLVEDDEQVRRSSAAALARRGYTVLQARDGNEALESWQRHREAIDLLLTDVVMPGPMSGTALAARLAADKPRLRVIYSSGYAPASQHDFLTTGAHLPKPYAVARLTDLVRRVLDGTPPPAPPAA